jgi:arsenate reductase-like glutaredoxin family protein
VKVTEEIDARKVRYGDSDALGLVEGKSTLLVAKGKKVTKVDLRKDRPEDAALVGMMLGPTGNLRAPTLIVGKKVIVGFNEDLYEEVFGG